MKAITVTQLNNQIKSIVDSHFEIVYVEGEVSKVVYHNSGHLYFTLKDESSSISCAMWRSNLAKMKFKLREGEKVLVYGAVNVYTPRGEYKLIAQTITPSGIGALQKAYEQLKEELSKLGYFDEKNKKPLPKFPKRIAIITSRTAAALQDMLRIAKKRWLLAEFYLFNALVQGENAADDIALKIKLADEYVFEDGKGFDLIIVGRGGGSKEDLWAFNERVVADAIYQAKTPIISAVGHEIDYLISDFVADRRAATPSNAMEIALPDKNEILLTIDDMIENFRFKFLNILQKKEKNLIHLKELFVSHSPVKKLDMKLDEINVLKKNFYILMDGILRKKENDFTNIKKSIELASPLRKIEEYEKEIDLLKNQFTRKINEIIYFKEKELNSLKEAFKRMNPKNREKEGFAQLRIKDKKVSLNDIKIGDEFFVENATISILSKALKVMEN
ncbi:exodeoxyribonuclease VII large subunit [Lebetimonas natsushimae]|uniref:Exodeoxyribonuclease 7 large subunit n=1 Tax=Lebetimonas natsushimae TaxID=1936991 RepID=A0A292YFZ1_9BACT|nr:exodeoxyribonuclease VII large subunit [Lebetimonas natsushimae]GAX87890.1 exodeoxyribonuclease VII large subunit [Lebetimonas natsushimae]